jgi:hypothetical protein
MPLHPSTIQNNKKPINQKMLDLYSDYLISSFSYTTATGLSAVPDHTISHDKVTRFLSERESTSKDLWLLVKPTVREIEQEDGVTIFDDTIQEKACTDENDIIAWHFDHAKGRAVKGVNMLSCLYHTDGGTVPLAFEIVKKTVSFRDEKTGRMKRKPEETKNQMFRGMFEKVLQNQVKFSLVLADSWFASNENMKYVADHKKHFLSSMATIYQKRWKVEEYHKSIKSNTALAKSPTKTVLTQSNHFFASVYAFFKLELLSVKTQLNHFALKSKIYLRALLASWGELRALRGAGA